MNFRGIVKKAIPKELFNKVEPWGHLAEAVLFQLLNGFPARDLKIIGVTGTNGKTTTAFLIHNMLHKAGYSVGLLSTVGWGMGGKITPQVEHMTTMPVPQLLRRIKILKQQGAKWVVLEVTSHAMAQNRVWGMPIDIAVMTNVTHEHLDYHGTFENYLAAKRKLFVMCGRNKKGSKTGVVNADDPNAELFVSAVANPITYGIKSGDLRGRDVKSTSSSNEYVVDVAGASLQIKTNLGGSFNVYNSLAAVAVGQKLGLSATQIQQGIASLQGVEGRMFSIDEGQGYELIVDYAHTPDSFEKLFADLKPTVKGRLIVMFGSAGGQRDKLKRPIQGELAGKYADVVILTEEDDRDTPGMDILNQIAAGAEKCGKKIGTDLFLVHDRTEAIRFTLGKAKKRRHSTTARQGARKEYRTCSWPRPLGRSRYCRPSRKNKHPIISSL